MKTYEPGWISFPRARLDFQHVGAAAGTGDDRTGKAVFLEQSFCLFNCVLGLLNRSASLREGTNMLRAAVIGLQARKAKLFRLRDFFRQSERRLAGRDPAAAHADLELDIYVELRIRTAQRCDVLGIVDADADLSPSRELREPRDLLRADHFVRNQHVADAALDHRLGLRHLLAADADRARGNLAPGNLGAFVRLGVWTHANGTALQAVLQREKIFLESIEIEKQSGCVDLLQPLADARRHSHGYAAAAFLKR